MLTGPLIAATVGVESVLSAPVTWSPAVSAANTVSVTVNTEETSNLLASAAAVLEKAIFLKVPPSFSTR